MLRDREHLPLPVAGDALERRKRPAPPTPRANRGSHGQRILDQARNVGNKLKERLRPPLHGLNPANIFRIHIAKGHSLDEEHLRRMGLILLGTQQDKAFVVSADDVSLGDLQHRILNYSGVVPGGAKYAELDAIESFSLIEPVDRIGARLKAAPLAHGEIAALDVELWHWGSRAECLQRLDELKRALSAPKMGVPDYWIGEGIFVARIKVDTGTLEQLLRWPAIKEIDRRPRPALTMSDYYGLNATDVIPAPLPDDAVGILIFDSGVASLHPLLGPAMGDSQAFPEAFRNKLGASDADEHGHGTAVAGLAVYGDLAEAVRTKNFQPSAQLFSARVLDKENQYDEDALVETQLEAALEYFLGNYPHIRVVNLSLGALDAILGDARYQLRFAAALDELARRYQDREVVFIVAAGNLPQPGHNEFEDMVKDYPNFLLQPDSRIVDPASAALALTVGGLSPGLLEEPQSNERVRLLSSGGALHPAPFTRTGPGLNGAIKPELVEEAGDYAGGSGGYFRSVGVLSTSRDFTNTNGTFLKPWVGTSFAAPRVANMAARLIQAYPGYSSNLIRALLVHSARVPECRPPTLMNHELHAKELLRLYGYGRPSLERALKAASNDAWLTTDGVIQLDSFQIFQLPALPDEFVNRKGRRRIAVTVAFDPPTRSSRADSYLGVTIDFALWRNIDHETLANAYRKWDRDEQEELDDGAPPGLTSIKENKIELLPKAGIRRTSTVQHAWRDIQRPTGYEATSPLFLVLVCQRKWAPSTIESQRYGVVLSLSHEDESVDLHAELRIHPKIQTELRSRARARS